MQKRVPAVGAPEGLGRKQVPPATSAGDARCPRWRFCRMQFDGPWNWNGCKRKHWLKVLERLKALEQMTLDTIISDDESHSIPVGDLVRRARDRLVTISLDDVDGLFSLRVEGRMRVWAIQMGSSSTLELLWFDPNHEVCPSKKRHT